jgi:hypothetical protein
VVVAEAALEAFVESIDEAGKVGEVGEVGVVVSRLGFCASSLISAETAGTEKKPDSAAKKGYQANS